MKTCLKKFFIWAVIIAAWFITSTKTNAQSEVSYSTLVKSFINPDYARWGEVPLWWWEADSLNKERITWQLEKLSAKGVKAVCPIQRSPARSFPESFSKEWWEMISYVNKECERLGMHLWLYDQVGYGQYGWLEKAAAQVGNTGTSRVEFYSATANSDEEIRIELAEGKLLDARAFPVVKDTAYDDKSLNIKDCVQENKLTWKPPSVGKWKVAVSVAVPYRSFYLSDASADVFLQQLYQRIEDVVGQKAMGKSLAGVFQDEHPPTPRDIYTQELADTFQTMFGYDIARAIPALHFDVGDKTPKYRIDYFDAYLAVVEKTYWKKVYDWTAEKNILTSHDNWGRKNIYGHSQGYIDYFRTQRWFSAPGFDDGGQHALKDRNYYDTKIAASIARLYQRPRVWNEGFHSSGWGRTTNQTLSWLSASYAFGANLYDEHGLYYSQNASTWEHAAPDPHWNQPYWEYYDKISDWVARASYMMSQGQSVADVAVSYPVTSLLADIEKNEIDYNSYMHVSRMIYDAGMDNDIIDDQSIIESVVQNGLLKIRGNQYQALVFGPQKTMRLPVLKKALKLVEDGGTVIFYGHLPTASVENGKDDHILKTLLEELFKTSFHEENMTRLSANHENGGYAAFLSEETALIPSFLSAHIDRDFISTGGDVFVSHRNAGENHIYFIQNVEDKPVQLNARLRADGVPEIWDPFTGEIQELDQFERKDGYTHIQLLLEGNIGSFIILNPLKPTLKKEPQKANIWQNKKIADTWDFSVIATRDNQWGDFDWPPSDEKIGPEIRGFKYREENGIDGIAQGWHLSGFNDLDWKKVTYDQGPYWLVAEEIPASAVISDLLAEQNNIEAGKNISADGIKAQWREVTFSQKTGTGTPAPWGGHSGYPDGHYNKNFIQLREGRKILFTRIYSPIEQRAGLAVKLRNQLPRLWVNGDEENFLGTIGNLPLKKGYNDVLLDVPDGNNGMLYVQKEAPAMTDLEDGGIDPNRPELNDATWIWAGNSEGAYFRKTFKLDKMPETAQAKVTGVSGFRLFINGQKVEEDIGPWATWKYPKSVNIKPYLKKGENLVAVWGQFLKGMNVSYDIEYQGFILAGKLVFDGGGAFEIKTDSSWKGHTEEIENWQFAEFDDSGWQKVDMKGQAGDDPWGTDFLKNAGSSTTPYRPLSVNLETPLLEVFDEMPEIEYDIKTASDDRRAWYRFEVPPGLKEMKIPNNEASVWVNGREVPVNSDGIIQLNDPPIGVSIVAIRLKMDRGQYAGAAFKAPIKLKIQGGKIKEGLWQDYALPTYSGIGVYKQNINFSEEEVNQEVVLDLGEVYVAAEVFVDGKSVGIKVAAPFTFDISPFIKKGNNEFEVRVANTLAPHYSFPIRTTHLGPVESGLVGPVQLKIYR